MIGRTLSHYRIVEPLGAGGMGEVYRAHDEKLGRDVAVKVLPADALTDEAARRRFHQEAEALARLSHPHIATVFDVDSADGTDFIVMEIVPGPTLKERLDDGPLREKEVVRLGTQLVRGLMAAHEKGIVHRDLKPSNLSLTEDGLLKILDFGLVRLVQVESAGETAATETAAGRAAGTLPYMSPEQLRGRGVDARSDLYAVGAVLFELATGRRVFEQANEVELADAILHEPPRSPRSLKSTLSPGLESIVLKTLDKDPELRYQTAREMLVDLERLQVGSSAGSGAVPVPSPRRHSRQSRVLLPVLGGVALLATAAWWLWPDPSPRVRDVRPVTSGLPPLNWQLREPSWATDGSRLYYTESREDRVAVLHVPTSGGEPVEIRLPFSHEARIYGYLKGESALLMTGAERALISSDTPGVPLWLVRVPTGAPRRIGDLLVTDVAVSADESRLACLRGGELFLYDLQTAEQRPLGEVHEWAFGLAWGPEGRRLRFVAPAPDGSWWIWETTVEGEPPRRRWWCADDLDAAGPGPSWTTDGRHFVFSRWSHSSARWELFAVRDGGRFPWREPEPVQVTFGPADLEAGVVPGPDGASLFAYGEIKKGELVRFDSERNRFEPVLGGVSAVRGDVSADGQWVAWVSWPEETLWRSRLDGTERLQLTVPPLIVNIPRWSPDGQSIAFDGRSPGRPWRIYVVSARGGEPKPLSPADSDLLHMQPCWLPDGQTLVFSYGAMTSPDGIYRLDVATREITVLPGSEMLKWPKCGTGGLILANPKSGLPENDETVMSILRPGRQTWEPALKEGPGMGEFLGWALTRDGARYCGLTFPSPDAIVCYSIPDGRKEVLAETDGPLLPPLFPYMTLDANDAPIVSRDRSTREIYALEWEAP